MIGAERMIAYCRAHDLPLELCGKVVVATSEAELPALMELHRRGVANGVRDLAVVGPERLREIEPNAAGIRALHVPAAAITDYRRVAAALADQVTAAGGEIRLGFRVDSLARDADGLRFDGLGGTLRARFLVGAAGLHSDRLARLSGERTEARIVPFRGDYYDLVPARQGLVRGLIYPVPDARFPFLGVHFTRRVAGGVEAGPNAVLSLAREGYGKLAFHLGDALDTLGYGGFWRLASRHWSTGLAELWRAFSKAAFVRSLRRLVPELEERDLEPGPSGVRAQAVGRDGQLVDDFRIVEGERSLHVLNAPSPAATAALAIADEIVGRATAHFELGARR